MDYRLMHINNGILQDAQVLGFLEGKNTGPTSQGHRVCRVVIRNKKGMPVAVTPHPETSFLYPATQTQASAQAEFAAHLRKLTALNRTPPYFVAKLPEPIRSLYLGSPEAPAT